jgi:hypothetical protein
VIVILERRAESTVVFDQYELDKTRGVETYKLVLLDFVATGAIIGVQGQNMALYEIVQPVVDTLEKLMSTIRRALGKEVGHDGNGEEGRERCRKRRGAVVPVGRHGDLKGVWMGGSRGLVTGARVYPDTP